MSETPEHGPPVEIAGRLYARCCSRCTPKWDGGHPFCLRCGYRFDVEKALPDGERKA